MTGENGQLKEERDRLTTELSMATLNQGRLATGLDAARNRIRELNAELAQTKTERDRLARLAERDHPHPLGDIEPAIILNLIKRKPQKSRLTLADVEMVIEALESLQGS